MKLINFIKQSVKKLGPGFITGAADDDPSGIATYAQTGAIFGISQLWATLFSLPLMIGVQEMCGRIALASGHSLTQSLLKHYSRFVVMSAVCILLFANVFNIAADLAAMASSARLLIDVPFMALVTIFAVVSLVLEIFVPYKHYARYLYYLALTLCAYVITVFIVDVDWLGVLYATFVPHLEFSQAYFLNITAFFGTTISPYLFFWQASQEIEEHKLVNGELKNGTQTERRTLADGRFDTMSGCIFSNLIAWFIIVTTASTLYRAGVTSIETAADAALALKPLAGESAFLLFALGIISTGFLAIPVLAGSVSFALAELASITAGLDYTFRQARAFYSILVAIMALSWICTFLPISPIQLLYYAAVFNGICSAPLIFMILCVANNAEIMDGKINGRISNILGYAAFIVIVLSSLFLVATFVI